MKISKAFVGIIILFFVLSHLMVVSLFLCPVPKLLSLVVGKEVQYVSLAETPDYIEQVFSSEDKNSDYLLTKNYTPNSRLLVSSICNRVASKTLQLRHDKFFDDDERQELYLNTLDFGGDVIGISAASNYYFQKSVQDLSFEDALTLVGLYKIFR